MSAASEACQQLVKLMHLQCSQRHLQGQQSARNTRGAVGQVVVLLLLLVPRQRQRPVALPPTCAACVSICTCVLKEYARGSRPGSAAAATAAAEAEACRPAPHLIFIGACACVSICTFVLAKQLNLSTYCCHVLLRLCVRICNFCTSKARKLSTYCWRVHLRALLLETAPESTVQRCLHARRCQCCRVWC